MRKSRPPERLRKYDLPFYTRDSGQYVLHRIVKVNADGTYTLRGDHQIVNEQGVRPDQIIRPSVAFRHWYSETGYESLTQAQFSIPYVTACAMYHPEPGALWYQPETMKDGRIIALMNKVKADGFVKIS